MKSIDSRLMAALLSCALLLSACNQPLPEEPEPEPSSEVPSSSEPEPDPEPIENPVERPVLAEKIAAGRQRNSDTVGWIYIPDTTVDAAVLQYTDNSYYLRLDEDKKYDIFGCYFMDYDSVQGGREALSRNNIIYGHSDLRDNADGKKFSQLYKYSDVNFLREHPYIFYSTEDEEMTWQIFAVFYTHIRFNYIQANPSLLDFNYIISEAKLRSEYLIDMPITNNDKILTLSTCTVKYNTADPDNYRLVVMAKLLPNDQVLAPTMEAEVNPNPKRS